MFSKNKFISFFGKHGTNLSLLLLKSGKPVLSPFVMVPLHSIYIVPLVVSQRNTQLYRLSARVSIAILVGLCIRVQRFPRKHLFCHGTFGYGHYFSFLFLPYVIKLFLSVGSVALF